jgi:hypothetical protein
LRDDGLGWAEPPRQVMGLAELSNRNVQFIQHSANTSIELAGVEGGLLKSNDLGEHYEFKINYGQSDPSKYPYIHTVLIPDRYRDLILAGGWDNRHPTNAYLAYSKDHGETWVDISNFALAPEFAASDIAFITQDPAGRVLMGLHSNDTLLIAEVTVAAPPTLLTDGDGSRALALDSVTFVQEAFMPFNEHNFSADRHTRVAFFGTNIDADPTLAVRMEDTQHHTYSLPVESAATISKFPWIIQIVARLPDELVNAGEVQVSIISKGVESNRGLVKIH